MNISDKFLTALMGSAIALVQVQLAVALSSQEIGQIAKEITVVITGLDGKGSGVIVEQKDDTYYVLTAYHVISESGSYEVQTPDGKRYPIFRSRRIGNLDLALIWFESKNSYTVAKKSQSSEPSLGATVYYAGYPFDRNQPRIYRFFEARITGISSNSQKGYDLSYDGKPLPGMSGGPLLDEQGRLIGIHGKVETVQLPNGIQETVGTQAIPIEYYERVGGIAVVDRDNPPQLPPRNEPSPSPAPENNQPDQTPPNIPVVSEPSLSPQATRSPEQLVPYSAVNTLLQAQKAYTSQPASKDYFNNQYYFMENVRFLEREYDIDLPSDYYFSIRTTTRAAYHYAIPDNPNQKAYVGATFLERNSTANNPQMVFIICEAIEPGRTRPADPAYRVDGSLICSPGTQEVIGNN